MVFPGTGVHLAAWFSKTGSGRTFQRLNQCLKENDMRSSTTTASLALALVAGACGDDKADGPTPAATSPSR